MKNKRGRPYKKKLVVYTFPVSVVGFVSGEKIGAKNVWRDFVGGLVDELPVNPPVGWSCVPLKTSMLNKLWTRNSCPAGQETNEPKTIGKILSSQKD